MAFERKITINLSVTEDINSHTRRIIGLRAAYQTIKARMVDRMASRIPGGPRYL
jgi:hypothetical protein